MTHTAPSSGPQPTRPGQSAEMVVSLALLGVCLAAGVAAWLLSSAPETASTLPSPSAMPEISEAREIQVINEWQSRIERDFSQREQHLRQRQHSSALQEQAEALALAQAAAEAAARAAAEAEARARRAELAKQTAEANALNDSRGDEGAPGQVAAFAIERPASVDWQSCEPPDYPRISQRRGEEGAVLMLFNVDAQGRASGGKVVESSGFQRLDEAALAALSLCRFHPAESADGAVLAAQAQVRFAWNLN